MTTFEQLLGLQACLLARYAECHNYAKAWGKDFVFKTIETLPTSYKDFKFDPNELTADALKQLGFRLWDDSGLLLIPLWLRPFLKVGSRIVSINGDAQSYSPLEDDSENRLGMLAYGVFGKPEEEKPKDPVKSSEAGYDEAAEKL